VGKEGWTCAWGEMKAANPAWGRCMGPATSETGLCWDDGDCAKGEVCTGEMYCPCDLGCGMADRPGHCRNPADFGDVGDTCDGESNPCKPALACCYPCGIQGCEYTCAVPCDASEPWCSNGCAMMP
jgi:hypothetical protein